MLTPSALPLSVDTVLYVICILQPDPIFRMGFSVKGGRLHFHLPWHATPANLCVTTISVLEPSLPRNDVYLVYTICLESAHGDSGLRLMKVTPTELLNVANST